MFDNIRIGGLEPSSMLERKGYISSIVFMLGCNFRCPFCHNPELVEGKKNLITPYPVDELFKILRKKKGWVDTVIFTGGEPTIYNEMPELMLEIKKIGFEIGLHTNGTNPNMIKKLLDKNVLNYISMDVKNAGEADYKITIGNIDLDYENILKSIDIIKNTNNEVDAVFRTTVVPGLVDEKNIKKIGELLKGAKKMCLQKFRPMKCLDKDYEKRKSISSKDLHIMADMLEKYVDKVDRDFI